VSGGGSMVGGIVGSNGSNADMCFIEACKNSGPVSGSGDKVGGIAGHNERPITACYNIGNVTAVTQMAGGIAGFNESILVDCYSTGRVSLSQNSPSVGGIIGYNSDYNSNIACYWLDRTDDTATYRAKFGIGNPATDSNAEKFASGSWPSTAADPEWGTGTGGPNGLWKSLGAWSASGTPPGKNSTVPKLWWEP
jgi:hypothetical protein